VVNIELTAKFTWVGTRNQNNPWKRGASGIGSRKVECLPPHHKKRGYHVTGKKTKKKYQRRRGWGARKIINTSSDR